ncbi:hypothetical protein F4778DRAFT_742114 [Xylariomycetidae sp. FL2044]|nr:hypothetical protein F4778DRAFT_742114 [Xylariomycetidae sp. FL2044]
MGCCTSNPCQQGGVCPDGDLEAARLADDPKSASVFIGSSTTTSTTTTTRTSSSATISTSTATSTATTTTSSASNATPTAALGQEDPSPSGGGSSIGGVVGGTIGGVAALLMVLAIFLWYRKKQLRSRQRTMAAEMASTSPRPPPWSPYQDTFTSTPIPMSPSHPHSEAASPGGRRKSITSTLFSPFSTVARSLRSSTASSRYSSAAPTPTLETWAAAQQQQQTMSPSQRQGLNTISELDNTYVAQHGGFERTPPAAGRANVYHELSGSEPPERHGQW